MITFGSQRAEVGKFIIFPAVGGFLTGAPQRITEIENRVITYKPVEGGKERYTSVVAGFYVCDTIEEASALYRLSMATHNEMQAAYKRGKYMMDKFIEESQQKP